MLPYLQRKIFNTPWSDGLKLADMIEYAPVIAEVEQLDETERLGLSPREKEIFILLLGDSQRKHIANTLKVGEGTVNFHVNNLYRKLGIQSRAELFTKHGKYGRKVV
jgi:DNA-binding NarL/FixJ family response regulator